MSLGPTLHPDLSQEEGYDPLEIFPDRVWITIVSILKPHPDDLWSLLRAFPSLRAYLPKTTWSFDLVIDPLAKYLSRHDLLTLLQVCSWWRLSANSYLSERLCYKPWISSRSVTSGSLEDQSYFANVCNSLNLCHPYLHLEGRSDFLRFSQFCRNCLHSPFVGRAASFLFTAHDMRLRLDDNPQELYTLLSGILSTFGTELWNATLPVVHFQDDHQLYLSFRRVLEQVPNLRYLKLVDYFVTPPLSCSRETSTVILEETFGFPALAHLVYLDVSRIMRGYQDVMPCLQKYMTPNIRILIISASLLCSIPEGTLRCLENVYEVQLFDRDTPSPHKERYALSALAKLGGWTHFQKLLLGSWSCVWEPVTKLLQRLKGHLNTRILWLFVSCIRYDVCLWNDDREGEEDVPPCCAEPEDSVITSLESMTLWLDENFSLKNWAEMGEMVNNLLKCTPNLVYLKIRFCFDTDAEEQIGLLREDGEGSSGGVGFIWEALPQLQLLVVGMRRFNKPKADV